MQGRYPGVAGAWRLEYQGQGVADPGREQNKSSARRQIGAGEMDSPRAKTEEAERAGSARGDAGT